MFEYIEEDKVTTDMGGTLEFDANEWTQHRSVSNLLVSRNGSVDCN